MNGLAAEPPTHSWSLGFVKCAPPAPRPLPLAIPLERFRSALACAYASRRASAVAPSLFLPFGASFIQLLHVRVELRLVLRRECRTDLGALPLHGRLKLLPISRRAKRLRFRLILSA